MALFSMSAAVEALDDLLEHERRMILSGKIDALLKLAPEKERLLTRLPGAVRDPTTLEHLRAKVTRNQNLLTAAAHGIKAVRHRLDAAQARNVNLRTYRRDGVPTDLGRGAPGFNKRA